MIEIKLIAEELLGNEIGKKNRKEQSGHIYLNEQTIGRHLTAKANQRIGSPNVLFEKQRAKA